LGREAEQACDAWVVQTLPGQRRAYAEALLEVCRQRSPAGLAALGAAGARRDLERRLIMVMRDEVPCRVSRRMLLAVVFLAALAVPAWTVGQEPTTPATPAVERATTAAAQPVTPAPVRTTTAEVPAGPKKEAGASERDRKVRELEEKVRAMLKELEALRKSSGGTGATPKYENKPETGRETRPAHRELLTGPQDLLNLYRGRAPADGELVTITLTRATYKLPAGKAEAVAKFLKEHVKASVLETKAEGDSLIVTTTPDVQGAIGQLVLLVQGKRPAGTPYYAPSLRSDPNAVYPSPSR
jgi:hypothetical protein